MKTKKTDKQIEFEKRADEARFDTAQRARDTVSYEQMLMSYIEDIVTGRASFDE